MEGFNYWLEYIPLWKVALQRRAAAQVQPGDYPGTGQGGHRAAPVQAPDCTTGQRAGIYVI